RPGAVRAAPGHLGRTDRPRTRAAGSDPRTPGRLDGRGDPPDRSGRAHLLRAGVHRPGRRRRPSAYRTEITKDSHMAQKTPADTEIVSDETAESATTNDTDSGEVASDAAGSSSASAKDVEAERSPR